MNWKERIAEINKTTDFRMRNGIGIYKIASPKVKRPLAIPIKKGAKVISWLPAL